METDYIRRADAVRALMERYHYDQSSVAALYSIPTADVQPVKEGEWVREMWFRTCSECGATTTDKDDEGEEIPDNFCPNCGAKMGGTP